MENNYKLADIKDDKKVIDKITMLEKEISEKTNQKIVLIAYAD